MLSHLSLIRLKISNGIPLWAPPFVVFLFFLTSACEKDEAVRAEYETKSFTAKLGDTLTIKGSNLDRIGQITFASDASQTLSPAVTTKSHRFVIHTSDSIQVIVPKLYSDKVFLNIGSEKLDLNIVGFIPMDLPFYDFTGNVESLKVIDEEVAFVLYTNYTLNNLTLYRLTNGYYDAVPVAKNVHFFGFFDAANGWYVGSENSRDYTLYFTEDQGQSYTARYSFSEADLEYANIKFVYAINESQVLLGTSKKTYVVENDELIPLEEKFPNLEPGDASLSRIYSREGEVLYGIRNDWNLMSFDFEKEVGTVLDFNKFSTNFKFFGDIGYVSTWNEMNEILYKSEDKGKTWNLVKTPQYELMSTPYVDFINAKTGFLFINHRKKKYDFNTATAWITENGGASWQKYYNFYQEHKGISLNMISDFKGNTGLLCCSEDGELFKLVRE